jgi:molecular chaperone HtpG
MAPYRSGREETAAPASPGTGLVADMVRQFADPYAFLRELVQNSMDAGARRIAVRVERGADGLVATSVSDDGCGMTRDVVEGPLLTLFSSSKEGDSDKIGKYGVGFVSVFAIHPDAVEVETWRDKQAWRLVLRPDTSYQLEDAGPREGSGTRVSLLQRMDGEAFAAHAGRARAALRRWCRHADCAIELRVIEPGDAGANGGAAGAKTGEPERMDRPLAVLAPVWIKISEEDLTVAVGPSAGSRHLEVPAGQEGDPELSQSFAGFYNRGLTLYETAEEVIPGLSGVRFKAMSPRFQHTLSRDNVRRDDAFREALLRVRAAVRGPLRRELEERLGPAAAAAAGGRDVAAYVALVEAALAPPIALDPEAIPFPLAHPIEGQPARADLGALLAWRAPLLTAGAADAITEALARRGVPAVLCCHAELRAMLRRCYPKLRLAQAKEAYLVVSEPAAAPGRAAEALAEALVEALARAGHEVARVAFCRVQGALARRAGLLLPEAAEEEPRLFAGAEIVRRGARWRATDALHLNLHAHTVSLARRRAADGEVAAAAALLARALLLEAQGPVGAGDSDRLLDLGEAGKAGVLPSPQKRSGRRAARRRAEEETP